MDGLKQAPDEYRQTRKNPLTLFDPTAYQSGALSFTDVTQRTGPS